MKRIAHLLAVALLAASAPRACATVDFSVTTAGPWTTYTYTYANTEEPSDAITAFHVYAPVSVSLLQVGAASNGWNLGVDYDSEFMIADIFWVSPDPDSDSISYGEQLTVTLVTSASVSVLSDWVLPDFPLGNWGYETVNWAGYGTFPMVGSVPVPSGFVAETPEPGSLLVMALGAAVLGAVRRR